MKITLSKITLSKITLSWIGSLFIAVLISGLIGFPIMNASTDHVGQHDQANDSHILPLEAGQSAFAAIAEIVEILDADPNTDWEKVDIASLREHLVDMDQLILGTTVDMTIKENLVVFKATGSPRTVQALQNMVTAHGKELDSMDIWSAQGVAIENGVTLSLRTENKDVMKKIVALGFFGLMATGAHHQSHHFSLAMGDSHIHK